MPEPDQPHRLIAGFYLAYAAEGDQAVILGLHVPTPEQQASGFTPHWEPLVNFDWGKASVLLQMFLDTHADLAPVVERKRDLEMGDLTAAEAWSAALAETRPGFPRAGPGAG